MGNLVMLQWMLSAVVVIMSAGGVACLVDVYRLTLACRLSARRLAELETR